MTLRRSQAATRFRGVGSGVSLRRRPARLVVLGLCWLGLLAIGPSLREASAQSRTIPLNHKRIQIERLIVQVGEATGRTIIFDEQVRGIVSIVTKRPVTLDEAWAILDSSLSVLGFSLLPSTVGNWKILKIAQAVGEAPFVAGKVGDSDSFVTALIPLRESNALTVLQALSPITGSIVTLVPHLETNSIIAIGPERAIARITTIADELDRVDEMELKLRVLRYRDVSEVEPMVEAQIEALRLRGRDLQVWSDARTNAIVFRGTEMASERLIEFLDRVDRPIEGSGEIRILRVLHRDPEEVADLIRGLSGRGGRSSGGAATAGPQDTLSGSDYSIAVDKASRSLVVRATSEGHAAIREALEILDAPQELIAIDITITEVRTPRAYQMGFAFNLPLTPGDDADELVGRLISTPGGTGLLAQPTQETRLFGRVSRDAGIPFTVEGEGGVEIPIEDTGVIDAGELRAQTNVLIQPSLIVTAGDEHEIFVGDNIPVPVTDEGGVSDLESGEVTQGSGRLLARTTRFEREDIGTRLRVEALAGREGKIQLDLDIELSSLAPSLAGAVEQVGPTFVRQNLVARARLEDGEVAILAIDEEARKLEGKSGTPWLSEIPFLGYFFSREVEQDLVTRLVIAARATRISTPAELVADTIRRRLAFERSSARDAVLPSGQGSPYGVRVTTRTRRDDAEAIAHGLSLQGHRTEIQAWKNGPDEVFDVYVISLDSMADAAELAHVLSDEGWQTDLVVLPTRS